MLDVSWRMSPGTAYVVVCADGSHVVETASHAVGGDVAGGSLFAVSSQIGGGGRGDLKLSIVCLRSWSKESDDDTGILSVMSASSGPS